jgi:hypothetical protein
LYAPTNLTEKLKLMGRGGQFTYISTPTLTHLPPTAFIFLASGAKIKQKKEKGRTGDLLETERNWNFEWYSETEKRRGDGCMTCGHHQHIQLSSKYTNI